MMEQSRSPQQFEIHECFFQLRLLDAQVHIRFPCRLFISWKEYHHKKSWTVEGSQEQQLILALTQRTDIVIQNGIATFDQTLQAQKVYVLYDLKNKCYVSHPTWINLMLVSNRKPDQQKLVGRIPVDLAKYLQGKHRQQSRIDSLQFCSVKNATLNYEIKLLSKNKSVLKAIFFKSQQISSDLSHEKVRKSMIESDHTKMLKKSENSGLKGERSKSMTHQPRQSKISQDEAQYLLNELDDKKQNGSKVESLLSQIQAKKQENKNLQEKLKEAEYTIMHLQKIIRDKNGIQSHEQSKTEFSKISEELNHELKQNNRLLLKQTHHMQEMSENYKKKIRDLEQQLEIVKLNLIDVDKLKEKSQAQSKQYEQLIKKYQSEFGKISQTNKNKECKVLEQRGSCQQEHENKIKLLLQQLDEAKQEIQKLKETGKQGRNQELLQTIKEVQLERDQIIAEFQVNKIELLMEKQEVGKRNTEIEQLKQQIVSIKKGEFAAEDTSLQSLRAQIEQKDLQILTLKEQKANLQQKLSEISQSGDKDHLLEQLMKSKEALEAKQHEMETMKKCQQEIEDQKNFLLEQREKIHLQNQNLIKQINQFKDKPIIQATVVNTGEEIEKLKKQLKLYQIQIVKLAGEVDELRNFEIMTEELNKEKQMLVSQISGKNKELQEFRAQIEHLSAKIAEKQKKENSQLEIIQVSIIQCEGLKKQLEEKEDKIKGYQEQLKMRDQKIIFLEKELQKNLEDLKNQEDKNIRIKQDLNKTIDDQAAEIELLNKKEINAKRTIEQLQEQLRNQSEIKEKSNINQNLRKELEEKYATIKALTNDLERISGENENLKKQGLASEEKMKNMQRNIQQKIDECLMLNSEAEANLKLQKKNEQEIENEKHEIQQLNEKLTNSEKIDQKLRNELTEKQAQIQKLKANSMNREEKHELEVKQLNGFIEQLSQELQNKTNQLNALKDQLSNMIRERGKNQGAKFERKTHQISQIQKEKPKYRSSSFKINPSEIQSLQQELMQYRARFSTLGEPSQTLEKTSLLQQKNQLIESLKQYILKLQEEILENLPIERHEIIKAHPHFIHGDRQMSLPAYEEDEFGLSSKNERKINEMGEVNDQQQPQESKNKCQIPKEETPDLNGKQQTVQKCTQEVKQDEAQPANTSFGQQASVQLTPQQAQNILNLEEQLTESILQIQNLKQKVQQLQASKQDNLKVLEEKQQQIFKLSVQKNQWEEEIGRLNMDYEESEKVKLEYESELLEIKYELSELKTELQNRDKQQQKTPIFENEIKQQIKPDITPSGQQNNQNPEQLFQPNQLTSKIAQFQELNATLVEQIKSLEKDLAVLEAKCETAVHQKLKIEGIRANDADRIVQLEDKVDELELGMKSQGFTYLKIKQEKEKLGKQLEKITQELKQKKDQLSKMQINEEEISNRIYNQTKTTYENRITGLQSIIHQLQDKLAHQKINQSKQAISNKASEQITERNNLIKSLNLQIEEEIKKNQDSEQKYLILLEKYYKVKQNANIMEEQANKIYESYTKLDREFDEYRNQKESQILRSQKQGESKIKEGDQLGNRERIFNQILKQKQEEIEKMGKQLQKAHHQILLKEELNKGTDQIQLKQIKRMSSKEINNHYHLLKNLLEERPFLDQRLKMAIHEKKQQNSIENKLDMAKIKEDLIKLRGYGMKMEGNKLMKQEYLRLVRELEKKIQQKNEQ